MSDLIEVEPRIKAYESYDFCLLGTPITGLGPRNPVTLGEKLALAWRTTMRRCYDPTSNNYRLYGAKGISVCKRWHQVSQYIADVQCLHGWEAKRADWSYELDKDYYSSNQYGPDTCIWLSRAANTELQGRPVSVTDCFNTSKVYMSESDCGRSLGICSPDVHRALKHGRKLLRGKHIGWKFEYLQSAYPLRRPLDGL